MEAIDLAPLDALLLEHGFARRTIFPLAGGASTRRYFRIEFTRGGPAPTAIAMFVPDGDRPEEIERSGVGAPRRWPFLEVRDLLFERGVRVPALFADGSSRGWLVLEDLGDRTLAEAVRERPEEKPALYTKAVTDLAHAHLRLADLPDTCIVRNRRFDFELLRWELAHFREWGLDARGRPLSPAAGRTFDGLADRLAQRVAEMEAGFVHRDYQSRNLMVVRDEASENLAWIDFQDALTGPRVYDLVALLGDSYQHFERAFIDARLLEYLEAKNARSERDATFLEFDLVTVQRKLKDAGRFVFIDRVKKNPAFLPFIEPTLAKVKAALVRLEHEKDMRTLADILADVLASTEENAEN